ncbi:hypothetical protein HZC21_02215 [Candidatus Peregrinibacteria bacterium]|nr:hypothetical protein [Candidatus Peregrinibacteria bacterium]
MEKSNKPQAIALFRDLFRRGQNELWLYCVPHIRERIFRILEEENKKLLPPDGITDQTDLYPALP